MYAREKAAQDRSWVDSLQNFLQALTQAVAKVDRAAIVASLLATEPKKTGGELGKAVLRDLANIFHRQSERGSSRYRRGTWRRCCGAGSSSPEASRIRIRSGRM